MRHFLKIADGIDVAPLNAALDCYHGLWNRHQSRRDEVGSPHRAVSDIWVRYNAPERLDPADPLGFNDEHVPVWYPAWAALPALRPIVFSLMALVEGEMLGGVLITRIAPGAGIAPHVDAGWHVDYFDKFYLSLRSAPGAVFYCDHDGLAEALEPRPGEVWRFDNRKRHWVENASGTDRVTLILCIRTDRFRSNP
jgi:hypothetical protein